MPSSIRLKVFLIALTAIFLSAGRNANSQDQSAEPDAASEVESSTGEQEEPFYDTSLHVEANANSEMADGCSCEACKAAAAAAKQDALKKAVAAAYAPLFFNNNFNYLCNPEYCDWHLGEDLKRMCLGECSVLDLGGQYRARHHSERNHRGVGLTGVDDDFLLHRTRLFANAELGQRVRFYAEYIDAESNYENFAPRGIEVNRSDMQNLFADVRLLELDGGDIWARVGRQELLYGSQRLVSPLDWANTRRNFDGVDIFYKGTDWNIDAFLTHPILADPRNFDSYDENQDFSGAYATYKGRKDETIDIYYLHYRNGTAAQGPNGLYFETLGSRWQGTAEEFLWDFEGGYQFGRDRDNGSHEAFFGVAGLGRKIDHCWKPVLWVYYDYSSGGDVLAGRQGFDHLFPLGHKYHGFMDLYARSNIVTPNLLLTAQPREKVSLLFWYHYFFLESKNDTPYNITMAPFNPANAPLRAELGHEIDTTIQWNITPRTDLLFGYSHFFAGDYYKTTPGVPFRGDADFFYTQYTVNF